GKAALIAKAEGRAVMDKVSANLESLSAEQHRLLAERSAQSHWSGKVLLTTDLFGVLLILVLAMYLIRGAYLSNRALTTSLTAAHAAKESLEAEVVAQEEHIGAVNEVVRHSFSVMENTFNTIAEAVLVVDTHGGILLTNPAAERLLGHRDDMSIAD